MYVAMTSPIGTTSSDGAPSAVGTLTVSATSSIGSAFLMEMFPTAAILGIAIGVLLVRVRSNAGLGVTCVISHVSSAIHLFSQ